ncbi:MAG: hypothetical protein PUB18_02610 [bacterium]|nr:hypothetical protein [bacterium]
MEYSEVKFMTPNGRIFMIPYDEVTVFCKEICQQEKYRERFELFKQDYCHFDPYFDFVMFELEYVMFNCLGNKKWIVPYQDALYEVLDANDLEHYSYEALKSNPDSYHGVPFIAKCSDSALNIHPISYENIERCMIDYNGICMMATRDETLISGSHALTSRTVLNQMISQNEYILEDFLTSKFDPIHFLIEYFGFVRITSQQDGGFIIGNSTVMNRELYQHLSDLEDFCFEDLAYHIVELDDDIRRR